MKKCIVAAACGCLSIGVCAEETNTITKANQTVITATRIETPIEQVGSSISVITAEEIQKRNVQNLQDALKTTPGLQFVSTGGPGTSSSVFIRGAESDHTLVLINGIRVNSNTSGDFDFSSIPTEMIQSIEVVRGPQSGLYGSDAMGGVINITTQKGGNNPFSGYTSLAVGEKGYKSASASMSGGNERADISASVSFYELENHDIAKNNGGSEDDPLHRVSFYANAGLNFSTDGRADLNVMYTRSDTDLDAFGGIDYSGYYIKTDKLITALSLSKPVNDRYTQKLSAGYSLQKYRGNSGSPIVYETASYDASLQSIFSLSENDTLSVGYDFRRSEAENKGNFAAQHRNQHAVFIHNAWDLNDIWYINLSARYDDFSDIDGTVTWKADSALFVLENTRLHGSVGTAYRAPTMNDLYYTFGAPPRTYLKPEESQSFDIGIEQRLGDVFTADLTFFKSDVENLIAWAPTGPGGSWQPSNVAEADIKGVELSLTASLTDNLTTKGHYTYTDAKDGSSGKQLARRAKNTAAISMDWDYSERGNIRAETTYTGSRSDRSNTLDGFVLVNVGTSYQLTDALSLFANVDNLFDKEYETAYGYGTVGRVASLGIKGAF